MPKISDHQSAQTVKLLFIGEAGSGKTGALCSLAEAGYNLRVLDLDNGCDILRNLTRAAAGKPAQYPTAAERLEYITLTEKMKAAGGKLFPATASVWPRAVGMLENWKDGELSHGSIMTWTPQDILVIDTLTALAGAAYNHILSLNVKLMTGASGFEYQRFIGQAQGIVDQFIEMITADEVKCNVIVNSHVVFVDKPGQQRETPDQVLPQIGFPSSLGKALSPKIPRRFNSVLLAEKIFGKHKIFVKTSQNINLKSSAPNSVLAEYSLETGLADYFKAVKGA